MGAATSPELGKLHCPTCGEPLAVTPSADPLATCLACSADHRFFVMPERRTQSGDAALMRLPGLDEKPPKAVAAFWLSDRKARSALNEQLAELLRTVIDSRRLKHAPSFWRCPICGEGLSEYEQPDIWIQELRCVNSHVWASRGGRLEDISGDARLTLHAELAEDVTRQLMIGWLKDRHELKPQLHASVRRVFESWLSERDNAS